MGGLSFFQDAGLRLLFFGGKGGVGKTTCAAAAALRLSRSAPGQSFLLVSTDPAHSLADSLADHTPPQNLTILEFNAQESFKVFQQQHRRKFLEIAARGTFLDNEDLSQLLDLSLPGLDELMALIEITGWAESGHYAEIIVDTAPTGHTLRLLAMPELMRGWLQVMEAMMAKHHFMQQRLQGNPRTDELDDFLKALWKTVKKMGALLRDPRICRFVPVMLAEELSVRETVALLKELERLHLPVKEIVVNRLYPESPCPVCTSGRLRQRQILQKLLKEARIGNCFLGGVPLYPEEIRGQHLESFWDGMAEIPKTLPLTPQTPVALSPKVENPLEVPPAATRFLVIAGKGGVGKTTVACATALHLAQRLSGKKVFLFSTDPAHSLSACLDVRLGSCPTQVTPRLMAMEIYAAAEFASLKKQFQQELSEFLGSLCQQVDLPFDRQVLERMLQISPPGLDEVMALTRTMEFLESGRYDVFILDSAPTGHLLRLLELPEIIDQWLKRFFGLLLKYRLVFRLPELSQRLVKLSKDLKVLRALWRDPARSAFYAVSIPTEMAWQETNDLIAACDRLGMAVPVIFLNLATPPSNCPLCSSLYQRESLVKAQFKEGFAGKHLTLIYRQNEPRGLQRLTELGQALYQAASMERTKPLFERPAGRAKATTKQEVG